MTQIQNTSYNNQKYKLQNGRSPRLLWQLRYAATKTRVAPTPGEEAEATKAFLYRNAGNMTVIEQNPRLQSIMQALGHKSMVN